MGTGCCKLVGGSDVSIEEKLYICVTEKSGMLCRDVAVLYEDIEIIL